MVNLRREIPENISFDQLVEDGKLVWNNELSKIKVASKESEKTNEDLIKFNEQDSIELKYFNQAYLEMAQEKSGLDSKEYINALSNLKRIEYKT